MTENKKSSESFGAKMRSLLGCEAASAAMPPAHPSEGVPEWVEKLAKSWDGCEYDAPGESIDIGDSIRRAALAATPAAPEAPASPTFMTADQGLQWAWNDVRVDLNAKSWNAGESANFYGFFLHGWNYRGQYELQRAEATAALKQELTAAPVVLPEPDFWVRPGATIHPDRGWKCWSNDGTSTGAFHADTVRDLLSGVSTPAAAPQAQADARDAERYRWLRDESWACYNLAKGKPEIALLAVTRDGVGSIRMVLAEEAMDESIDAAIERTAQAAAKGER